MNLTADPTRIRAWLELLHGDSPGMVHICAKGNWSGGFFADLDRAAAYAAKQDAAEGVYLRCTTLREGADTGKRGFAEDSLALPGLWADLDLAGVGHKQPAAGLPLLPDVEAARSILDALPEPTLWVHSGGGLYPWWLLEKPHLINGDLPEVEALSSRWHEHITDAAASVGWHVGGTGDLARVLRIPGTVNRKAGGERPCRVIEHNGPRYSLDELRAALPQKPARAAVAPPAVRTDVFAMSGLSGGPGPFDVLADNLEWRDLLEPAAFTLEGTDSDGRELWLRPGGESEYSLKAGRVAATVWSTDAGLPAGKGQKLTKGRMFAHLHHRGDQSAAARDLLAAAHGQPAGPASGLPRRALDAIAEVCPPPREQDSVPAVEDLGNDVQASTAARVIPLPERILSRAQLGSLPQPEPLIADTLDQRTVALLAGRNSTGKSFLALDWACCIVTGKAWQGRAIVEPGPVLYVAAEGAYGLDQRVTAWEYAWQRKADGLDVLPEPVNLFTGNGFGALQAHIAQRAYRLVVIDTWARSTVGGKENDNTDSTIAFERVDRLRRGPGGTTVLVVAHTDKGDTTTRGASALEDNADTLYRIKGDPRLLELSREKRKDGPRDDFHRLQLAPILDSCVVQNTTGQDRALSGNAEALMSAFTENFADMGASKAELRMVAAQAPATFQRSLKALVSSGALVNQGTDARPFYKPGPSA